MVYAIMYAENRIREWHELSAEYDQFRSKVGGIGGLDVIAKLGHINKLMSGIEAELERLGYEYDGEWKVKGT